MSNKGEFSLYTHHSSLITSVHLPSYESPFSPAHHPLGAALVAAAFMFPVWFPLTLDPSEIVLFPELPDSLQAAFEALPEEQRNAYLALRDQDVRQAALMAAYALQDPISSPEDQQENPNRSGQIAIRDGEFVTISPIRSAKGKVTLYELPDGSRYLWLEDFAVIPARGLRLFLSLPPSVSPNSRDESRRFHALAGRSAARPAALRYRQSGV